MTNEQKKQVRDALVRYTANYATQADASASLKGISATTISQVKNHNWELMSERMWHHIARQVGFYCGEWQPADTSAYLLLRILFADAQHYAMTYGIAMAPGTGKTFTSAHYTRENDHTFYIAGSELLNRRSFMAALMQSAGLEQKGTLTEMMDQFTSYLSGLDEPLVILDDAHKLKDRVLHMVVMLTNSLAGSAGVVIMGGDKLRMRIIDGMRLKKPGYDEIYRSIGRRFITMTTLAPKDVELVCHANGVHNEEMINLIQHDCNSNLHAATFLIQSYIQHSVAA